MHNKWRVNFSYRGTGSYDNTAKLLDARTGSCIQTVNHGAPIEDVLMFNSGTIYMTAGGSTVRVWDSLAGGKLLLELANHHKTVLSMAFAQDGTQLLTAGLDRWVSVNGIGWESVVSLRPMTPPIFYVLIWTFHRSVINGLMNSSSLQWLKQKSKPVRQQLNWKTSAQTTEPSWHPFKWFLFIIQFLQKSVLVVSNGSCK